MKKRLFLFLFVLFLWAPLSSLPGQEYFYHSQTLEPLSRESVRRALETQNEFFSESQPVKLRLESDFSFIKETKDDKAKQEARLQVQVSDSILMQCLVEIRPRGKSRLAYCHFPPLKIDFTESFLRITNLRPFQKVKMVAKCRSPQVFEEYVLTEFLIYKLYNIVTPLSFRARLARITFVDTGPNQEEWTDFGFILEETDAVANRFGLEETEKLATRIEQDHALYLSMFQYMIGNTDWHVPSGHNVKYLHDPDGGERSSFLLPYDFDVCGMVKANYALPRSELKQTRIRDRRFIGFTPSEEKLEEVISFYQEHRSAFYRILSEFEYLSDKKKKDLEKYLDRFYSILEDPETARKVFIQDCTPYNWKKI
jgi:hypothetical protein